LVKSEHSDDERHEQQELGCAGTPELMADIDSAELGL